MEIYIEYVLVDNMVMNYLIVKLINITTGRKRLTKTHWLTCVIGTIFAIFLPFLYFNKLLLFGYKIVVSIILVLLIKRYKKVKSFITYYLMFITYTFLLGGLCYGIINVLGIDYNANGLIIYSLDFPMGVLLIVLYLFIKILFASINLIKNRLNSLSWYYDAVLVDRDKRVETVGFLDTGNNIANADGGVNVISIDLFLKLYKDIDLCDIVLGKQNIDGLKNIDYISIAGIGKEDKCLTFVIDQMIVNGVKYDRPRLALAMRNFGDYGCILHKNFVKGDL